MSFIMHEEYLVDVPEECKKDFAFYILEYGLYGHVPKLKGFEFTFWKSVQRRIDTDKIKYQIMVYKNRITAINSRIRKNTASEKDPDNLKEYHQILTKLQERLEELTFIANNTRNMSCPTCNTCNTKDTKDTENHDESTCNTCNTQPYYSYSYNDSYSDIDSDSYSDNEFYSEDDDDIEVGTQTPPPPPPLMQTPSEEKFAEQVFEKFKNAGLPCQKGDLFKFKCADFRMALSSLKGLHSDDILKAIDNYITELNNPDSYELKKMSFDTLVGSKTFRNCLPDIYDVSGHDNFKKYKKHNEKESPPVEHHYEICPVCGQMTFEWKNDFQMYECDNCHHKATYEEVNSA